MHGKPGGENIYPSDVAFRLLDRDESSEDELERRSLKSGVLAKSNTNRNTSRGRSGKVCCLWASFMEAAVVWSADACMMQALQCERLRRGALSVKYS